MVTKNSNCSISFGIFKNSKGLNSVTDWFRKNFCVFSLINEKKWILKFIFLGLTSREMISHPAKVWPHRDTLPRIRKQESVRVERDCNVQRSVFYTVDQLSTNNVYQKSFSKLSPITNSHIDQITLYMYRRNSFHNILDKIEFLNFIYNF